MKGYFESMLKQHCLDVGQSIRTNLMRVAFKRVSPVHNRQTLLIDIADYQFSVRCQNPDKFFKDLAGIGEVMHQIDRKDKIKTVIRIRQRFAVCDIETDLLLKPVILQIEARKCLLGL